MRMYMFSIESFTFLMMLNRMQPLLPALIELVVEFFDSPAPPRSTGRISEEEIKRILVVQPVDVGPSQALTLYVYSYLYHYLFVTVQI